MRSPQSTAALLVALLASTACAHPWDGPAPLAHSQHHRHDAASIKYSLRNVFPQLTWLRDTVIEKAFGASSKAPAASDKHSSSTAAAAAPLPGTLLAKYGGDVVLRFNITTVEEEAALAEAADTLFLDVWEFTHNWADIRLREDDVSSLLGLLPKSLHKAYSHLMPDLARSIYQTYPSLTFKDPTYPPNRAEHAFTPALKKTDSGVNNIFFEDYQPLSVIVPWMRLMASMFTTHVRMINIGTSYEGRDIPALRIGVHPTNSQQESRPRKTIIIAGGTHAREWISVSTVTYIAWSLITSYGKSSGITKLLQEFDWVLIPTINVDGYVYTWENDRLWRKNRQQTNLRFCRGLDLDRGFGFEWEGTSYQSNPCSESYPGDEPFQAVESHRLAEWAKNETANNNVQFAGFLDMHSYSQQVLYPYSFSCSSEPPALENLEELAMGLAKAIRLSSGEAYSVSSACEGAVPFSKSAKMKDRVRMEMGGGSAIDWFYHEMRTKYSYQIKLRDTGSYGFLLPSENIVPTGEEAFNAVKYFGEFLLGDNGIEQVRGEERKDSSENAVGEENALPEADVDSSEGEVEEGWQMVADDEEVWEKAEGVRWDLRRRRR